MTSSEMSRLLSSCFIFLSENVAIWAVKWANLSLNEGAHPSYRLFFFFTSFVFSDRKLFNEMCFLFCSLSAVAEKCSHKTANLIQYIIYSIFVKYICRLFDETKVQNTFRFHSLCTEKISSLNKLQLGTNCRWHRTIKSIKACLI